MNTKMIALEGLTFNSKVQALKGFVFEAIVSTYVNNKNIGARLPQYLIPTNSFRRK